MAQPSPPVPSNGVPSPAAITETIDTPESTNPTVPVKRKREDGQPTDEDVEMKMDVDTADKPDLQDMKDPPELIQRYFNVINRLDPIPSILKRPLPEAEHAEEPDAKRQKSASEPLASSIAEKVEKGQYALLDDVANDLVIAIDSHIEELRSGKLPEDEDDPAQAIADVNEFRDLAMDIFRREMIYPRTAFDPQQKMNGGTKPGSTVLSFYSNALQGRQLFSALPLDGQTRVVPEENLPPGITATRLLPNSNRQPERSYTIGELFGPPRPLPALQHQPKPQPRGTTVGFYHPELTEKSKYRTNTYFSQKISVGHYLDYSKATPVSKSSRQRQRAESLAGRRPSASEQESAELEALFRSAFSSFAPSKDDSGAMVPASQAAQLYWQQTGYRNYDRMIDRAVGAAEAEPVKVEGELGELDEKLIEDAFEEKFDSSVVDPALASILGEPKSAEEKEVDELLDDVTDMIETILSHQRIRHLSSVPAQARYAGEAGGGDLLHAQLPAPSEEEIATYEALQAQLKLIIGTLPPHAVTRINGDLLEELAVSTNIEVLTSTSKGVMEDDAAIQARARQQQNAVAASAARPPSHRTPSASSYGNQYGANQYGTPSRQPMGQQNFYRPGAQTPHQQQPHGVPRPVAPHTMPHQQHRPQPNANQSFRPPNGYTNHFASQVAKAQTPYGHQQMPPYGQQRPQQYPYAGTPQHNSPSTRYAPNYQQTFPQQQQQHHQPPPGTPGNYAGYANGAGSLQPRTASPHVPYSPSPPMQQQGPHHPPRQGSLPQHQSPMPQQHYQPQHQQPQHQQHYQPQQPQQQHYRPPPQNMPGTPVQHQQYPNGMPQQAQTPHNQQGMGNHMAGHHEQGQRMMEQARARAAAQQNSVAFGDKIAQPGGNVSGLSGIGLSGNFNAAQYAAQQARMSGGVGSPANATPRPPSTGPNGTPNMARVSPIPPPGAQGQTPQPSPHPPRQVS